MDAMKYNDLRDFLTLLEQQGELKRITLPVDRIWKSLKLLTALCVPVGLRCCSKTLKATQCRCCATCSVPKARGDGHGQEDVSALREVGKYWRF
ncbi:3-octaprenyl-4-hydroxybenzoate carboxy-lyase [Escherichia coli]|uniref:3-octaprenyl-4-hydroxybenzoate carboxy-lyase n=1 Tax=Escherichia coli TaxID=562 RepID=A0A376MN51_ECOLX|nr:3-octaprenyl-4-hydroxybenzoate carboxy-lyase [Escherichia coli]